MTTRLPNAFHPGTRATRDMRFLREVCPERQPNPASEPAAELPDLQWRDTRPRMIALDSLLRRPMNEGIDTAVAALVRGSRFAEHGVVVSALA